MSGQLKKYGILKKLIIVICVVGLVLTAALALTGCSPSEVMLSAFDDDSIVISNADSSISIMSSYSNVGNKYTYSAGEFTGVDTIKNVEIQDDPIIDIDLTIESGEFKLVFVSSDTVYPVVSGNHSGELKTELKAGKYAVKMVGRYAKVSLSLNLDFTY